MKKLKTLVIDESRWARGGEKGGPALLNEDGNRCCRGFSVKPAAPRTRN